ncbi:hypothetical protein AKL58_23615, partial [Salmonella enterica]|nr:hypothetical protein [Salmonella enterica]
MRMKYWDLTEELNKAYNSLDISKSDISTLIGLELFISGCHFIDPSLHIDQAWSVLVGYDEPILKRNGYMEVVSRLRILFPELRSKKILSKRIQHYQAIDQKFRLFDINENGIAEKITPRFITNRQAYYEQVLNNPIPRQMDDTPFA